MEINRYLEIINKDLSSQVAKTEGGSKYIDKRIEQLKNNQNNDGSFIAQSVAEMSLKREEMSKQLTDLRQKLKQSDITSEELESIRFIIKDATLRIKIEPPDIQWNIHLKNLLSQYYWTR